MLEEDGRKGRLKDSRRIDEERGGGARSGLAWHKGKEEESGRRQSMRETWFARNVMMEGGGGVGVGGDAGRRCLEGRKVRGENSR